MCLKLKEMNLYKEQGYLFLPGLFSRTEVEIMKEQLPKVFSQAGPRRVVEKEGNVVRSVYGLHRTNEVFNRLSRHPRLVQTAMQLLESEVYIYQSKVNAKAAFGGDVWEWHQDFIFWQKEDAMLTPRIINAAVLLDEMTEFNGPIFLIPGSHAEGVIDMSARQSNGGNGSNGHDPYSGMPAWIADLTTGLKYSLSKDVIERLVRTKGIVAPKGPAGSVLFFDANIVHASPSNLSPFDRAVAFLTYNSVENVPPPVEKPRPDFLVDRQVAPIVPLRDDALLI
jgi:ectoine hydroxylase-related dioxygenase (phytanoyl-CoA dioxygenase family)